MPSRLALALPALLTACTAAPPAHWARGGAPIDLPRARWTFGETVAEIDRTGRVRVNGEPLFTIDRGGRVFDVEANPLALLEEDGKVVGPNDANLGFVGATRASLPGQDRAWLAVEPSGQVIRFDEDGERHPFGTWSGECARSPGEAQVCTLVTHLLGLRQRGGGGFSPGSVSVGVGLGVGVIGR